jgi:hypothetical protein
VCLAAGTCAAVVRELIGIEPSFFRPVPPG